MEQPDVNDWNDAKEAAIREAGDCLKDSQRRDISKQESDRLFARCIEILRGFNL